MAQGNCLPVFCGTFAQMSQPPELPWPPAGGFYPRLALPHKAGPRQPPTCKGTGLTVGREEEWMQEAGEL